MLTEHAKSFFDTMGGEFDARLKLNTKTTRTSKSDGRELTVSNPLAIIEARFSYKVLDRLYFPSFVAIERDVDGERRYVMFEVVGVSPTHYQLPGIDSSMPTLLRKEYLDTINESWGKSQETWIDLAAVPTNYCARIVEGILEFTRAPYAPLPGAKAWLLSKPAVEMFLCVAGGQVIGTMAGFNLPFTVDMDNMIRYHAGFFAFSLDHAEPIIYREGGHVKIGKIGELVDRFFTGNEEGRSFTSSIEALSFDPESLVVNWSPLQYVFRHRHQGNLLRFHLRTGRSVTVTPGHSLYVLKEGRIRNVPSTSLMPGDLLVGSRVVPSNLTEQSVVNLLDMCHRVGANGVTLVGVGRGAFEGLGPGVAAWKLSHWKKRGVLPIEYYGKLDQQTRESVHLSYKNCTVPLALSLTIDEDLARLLGYYTAEGHTTLRPRDAYAVQFTLNRAKDQSIVQDVRAILKRKFGIVPTVSRHGENAVRVAFRHKILTYFFSSLVGRGARNKRVPGEIMNSPPKIRKAFLRAWALGDNGVTTSRALANDVAYMLLMDGISATVGEWKGDGTAMVGKRKVNSSPRYEMHLPSGKELREGVTRLKRGRAEPTVPVSALPRAAMSLVKHPSHTSQLNPRFSGRLLEDVDFRLAKLNSYQGKAPKSVEEARHDGVYRTAFGKYIVRNGDTIASTQLLIDANNQIAYAKSLGESNLTFYEIQEIEEVEPSSPFVYDVSVPRAENFLAGFGGVFCHNTGSGKSNLASSLLRMALKRDPGLTAVVIDIAGEYAVNLLDLLGDKSRMVTTESFDNEQEFISSQAIPESLEEAVGRKAVEEALSKVWSSGVDRLSLQEGGGIDLGWIQQLMENTVDSAKAGGTAAKIALAKLTMEFYEKAGHRQSTKLTDLEDASRKSLTALLTDLSQKVHEKSGLKAEIDLILGMLESGDFGSALSTRLSPEKLAEQLAKGQAPRLNVLYLPEPMQARIATERLIRRLLFLKKKYGNKQRVLFLLDEAQEYIPDEHTDREFTTQSNRAVEQLLRQGRKYRLHCWMATQRVARLNVNALQQLHSYFVSTLPRMYDRMVIADAFALPYEVLERSADLGTGEWLFVSFKASKQRNVPVFLKTENNESIVAQSLK